MAQWATERLDFPKRVWLGARVHLSVCERKSAKLFFFFFVTSGLSERGRAEKAVKAHGEITGVDGQPVAH